MADPRLDPATAHPLNAADCARSAARIADIQLGLKAINTDRHYWRDRAKRRIAALEEDGADYGLLPNEEAELEQLRAMLADANARLAR